jgi:hypothetical protein
VGVSPLPEKTKGPRFTFQSFPSEMQGKDFHGIYPELLSKESLTQNKIPQLYENIRTESKTSGII